MQSFQLGWSHDHIFLHASILHDCNAVGILKTKPFCTLSEDPTIPIHVHLRFVFLEIKKTALTFEKNTFL